jgi:outer membrane phospholipase A
MTGSNRTKLKFLFFSLTVLFCTSLYGIESEKEVLSLNRNYVAIGDKSTPLKLEFGFRQRLFEDGHLFFGYHQKSIWDVHSNSSPILDTNYNPHLYYDLGSWSDIHWNLGIFEHLSNGGGRALSRGTNMSFINAYKTLHYSDVGFEFGTKLFITYKTDEGSSDLNEYMGTWSLMAKVFNFVPILENYHSMEVRVNSGGKYGGDFSKGNVELAVYYQPFQKALHTLFVQVFSGRNESLVDYKTYHHSTRIGLSLVF